MKAYINKKVAQKKALSKNGTNSKSGFSLEDNRSKSVVQAKPNRTGLPDKLKSGMENLSGHNLDHVKVHYNSSKPAAVQAHAYAQGSDIHLASGQAKHLPHELGHVVQQMQGRVKPTTNVNGMAVNDHAGLEREADVLGAKALQLKAKVGDGNVETSVNNQNYSFRKLSNYSLLTRQLVKRDNFSKEQRQKILAKNKKRNLGFYSCTHCGFKHKMTTYAKYRGRRLGDGGFHVDHKLAAARGGRALMRNATVLCGTCNTSKGSRATVGKRGIDKYRGLHGKSALKNYLRKRR